MTIIVETGANIANSNSYVSVSDADAYHLLFNQTDWSGLDTDKENALINATLSIELLYGQQYLSLPQFSTQSLLFPRFTFVINRRQIIQSGTIPTQLKRAVCEVALMYLNGLDVYPIPNNANAIKSNSVKIGELDIANTYGKFPKAERFAGFNKIDILLAPLLRKTDVPQYMSL